jgi:hypothetical protein
MTNQPPQTGQVAAGPSLSISLDPVAGLLAAKRPTPMRRVSLDRVFTTSGEPDELAQIYKLDTASLVNVCREFVESSGSFGSSGSS